MALKLKCEIGMIKFQKWKLFDLLFLSKTEWLLYWNKIYLKVDDYCSFHHIRSEKFIPKLDVSYIAIWNLFVSIQNWMFLVIKKWNVFDAIQNWMFLCKSFNIGMYLLPSKIGCFLSIFVAIQNWMFLVFQYWNVLILLPSKIGFHYWMIIT